MTKEQFRPTEVDILSSLLNRTAEWGMAGASVQRSHRFPLHIFVQVENMARMAEVSVSVIINQLLECGLQAIHPKLSEDQIREIHTTSKEQYERPTKPLKEVVKPKKKALK